LKEAPQKKEAKKGLSKGTEKECSWEQEPEDRREKRPHKPFPLVGVPLQEKGTAYGRRNNPPLVDVKMKTKLEHLS